MERLRFRSAWWQAPEAIRRLTARCALFRLFIALPRYSGDRKPNTRLVTTSLSALEHATLAPEVSNPAEYGVELRSERVWLLFGSTAS